ncbi:MAG: ATP-binding protein [Acidobacteriota bacterium]
MLQTFSEEELSILVVDDDDMDRLAVTRALEICELSVQVQKASSIGGAREALETGEFDCLILDYHLQDGHAGHLLGASGEAREELPPVIILTGSGNERIAVELMKAGALDYIPKDELTPSRIAQSVRHVRQIRLGEESLNRAYEELEARVVARTAELAQANQELEQEMSNREQAEERSRQHLEQLAHVARLSTLGEMAAGLGHELNQPLGAIANYASGCIKRIEAGNPDMLTLAKSFTLIAQQAERAGKIIHRLRTFVSSHEPETRWESVNEMLEEVVALERAESRYRIIDLVLDFEHDLPAVLADSIQIQQVVLNLMRNAGEAMSAVPEEDRRLTIRTRRHNEDFVRVTVEDRGSGCSPEVLVKLFEPFFSTKKRGMGMGLTICRSILEAHRGELWAEPNEDRGLSFHFTLIAAGESGVDQTQHGAPPPSGDHLRR